MPMTTPDSTYWESRSASNDGPLPAQRFGAGIHSPVLRSVG